MSSFERAMATVSWYELFRYGSWVFMRRGTGETGWWHAHEGETDYGGNPADFNFHELKDERGYRCRTCGKKLFKVDADKARESSGHP